MKYFLITTLITGALLTTSCKEDEEKSAISKFIGTWYISNISKSGCTQSHGNGSSDFSCSEANCSELILKKDGTFSFQSKLNGQTISDSGTYLEFGNTIEICQQNATSCSNYEFEFGASNSIFHTTETNGATGCVTVTTYIKK